MSDDIDKLRHAMRAATPSPDRDRKARNIAAAEKNFDRIQGSHDTARHTSERPNRGAWRKGAFAMLTTLSRRSALGATTAIALVAVVLVVPVLQNDMPDILPTGAPGETRSQPADGLTAPVVEEAAEEAFDFEDVQMFSGRDAPVTAAPPVMMDMAEAPPSPAPGLGGLMSMNSSGGTSYSKRAASPSRSDRMVFAPEGNTEAYPEADTNPLKVTAQDPVSTFSIDVDTAGWSVLRNMLEGGQLPAKDTVRIEEMVNYFPYDYPAPEGDEAFRTSVTVADTPWNDGTQLVHIGIQGALPEVEDRPPLNLVFLVDVSGSMEDARKLPLLKQSLKLMLGELRPEDEVAIVTYAGSAGVALEPTKAADRDTIIAALNTLGAGGGTAGAQGIESAYAMAERMSGEGEVNRVLLATDGDFNIGIHDVDQLKSFIEEKRESGTYLSVLGFGRGNLDDTTMQTLAQNGNGIAAYIDTLSEAQKVLVDQLTGALFPIADDVKIQIEFNPAQIAEYRLIGYETRGLKREDFNNDRVDAGDIGAGHQVTAIYEVTPVGSDARRTDPLRYQAEPVADDSGELGFLRLRYKAPGENSSQLIEAPITEGGAVSADMRFAFAIAGFGQLLRGGEYLGDWSFGDAIALANGAKGADEFGYRAGAVRLMRLAETITR